MQEFGEDRKISKTQFLLLAGTINYLFHSHSPFFLLTKVQFCLKCKVSGLIHLSQLFSIWMVLPLGVVFECVVGEGAFLVVMRAWGSY